ncbi:hypothetical protein DRP04_07025 [Archaeoglobales archaeon]|nr:MAG: hypothetical protein DRP04_07025 [Archaeoglobales archaeon]
MLEFFPKISNIRNSPGWSTLLLSLDVHSILHSCKDLLRIYPSTNYQKKEGRKMKMKYVLIVTIFICFWLLKEILRRGRRNRVISGRKQCGGRYDGRSF